MVEQRPWVLRNRGHAQRKTLPKGCGKANYSWFFSGLLIGAELGSIGRSAENRPVILGVKRGFAELCGLALEIVAKACEQY